MTIRLAILAFALLSSSAVMAAERPVTFINMSPDAVTGIAATDKSTADAVPLALLATALAIGEMADAKIGLPDEVCVVDITITFASGKQTLLTDTDLCQTDQITIE